MNDPGRSPPGGLISKSGMSFVVNGRKRRREESREPTFVATRDVNLLPGFPQDKSFIRVFRLVGHTCARVFFIRSRLISRQFFTRFFPTLARDGSVDGSVVVGKIKLRTSVFPGYLEYARVCGVNGARAAARNPAARSVRGCEDSTDGLAASQKDPVVGKPADSEILLYGHAGQVGRCGTRRHSEVRRSFPVCVREFR